jgi:hypothetical protein
MEDSGLAVDLGVYSAPNQPRSPFLPRSFLLRGSPRAAHASRCPASTPRSPKDAQSASTQPVRPIRLGIAQRPSGPAPSRRHARPLIRRESPKGGGPRNVIEERHQEPRYADVRPGCGYLLVLRAPRVPDMYRRGVLASVIAGPVADRALLGQCGKAAILVQEGRLCDVSDD